MAESSVIIRRRVHRDFTTLPNDLIRDKRISWKALGLLVFVLSLPDNFCLRLSHLAKQKKTGRDATRAGLKELELAGYLTIRRERGERGKFSRVVWEVTMSPSATKIDPCPPRSENPNTVNPNVGKPISGKPTLTSTCSKQELNTRRTTTTKATPPAKDSASGVVVIPDDFKWPTILGGTARASAVQILQNCPLSDRQNVLHEIAGLADRNAVRHPIGLLRTLVDRAKHGQFVPAAALEYQRKLESQAKPALLRSASATAESAYYSSNPREHLEAVRRALSPKIKLIKGPLEQELLKRTAELRTATVEASSDLTQAMACVDSLISDLRVSASHQANQDEAQ